MITITIIVIVTMIKFNDTALSKKQNAYIHQSFTCPELNIETLEKGVKHIQS